MLLCNQVLALLFWCYNFHIIVNNRIWGVSAWQQITPEPKQAALTPGVDMILKCYMVESEDVDFVWFRRRQYSSKETPPPSEGFDIKEELRENNAKYKIEKNGKILVIKSPSYSDVGDYYCRVKSPSDYQGLESMITVRVKPYIQEFDLAESTTTSAIILEGKSLKIPCNVIDDYAPESNISISWQMSKFDENDMNDVINGEEGIKTESYNSTSSALIIDRVTKDHRRFYKCHVTNGITENSKVILLRVKDKFIVLWPTVGIILELVILIGIIVVVENRKVEPDKDTSDRKAIQM